MNLQSKQEKKTTVAIDESSKGDYFILAALEVTPKQESLIVRKLNDLRQEIKGELLKAKPSLSEHPKLMGSQLPELHGEWLFQSQEYYRISRKYPSYTPTLWQRQVVWYERAIKIIMQSNCKISYQMYSGANTKLIDTFPGFGFDLDNKDVQRMLNILSNAYIQHFPKMLVALDYRGEHNKKIISDNYDSCKGFSDESLYRYLRSEKLLRNVSAPSFLSSEDEVLIQAVDLVVYLLCVNFHSRLSGTSTPKTDMVSLIYKKWLRGRIADLGLRPDQIDNIANSITWALALERYMQDATTEEKEDWAATREDDLHSAASFVQRFGGGTVGMPTPFQDEFYRGRAARLLDDLDLK